MANLLKLIGLWKNLTDAKDLWHPRGFVDSQWQPSDKEKIVDYLRTGRRLVAELGYSFCRFADGPPPHKMGCWFLTDGTWVWPEGLWVYVQDYCVRVPDEFLDTIRSNHYCVPDSIESEALSQLEWDDTFWRQWCSKHYHRRPLLHVIVDWLLLLKHRTL